MSYHRIQIIGALRPCVAISLILVWLPHTQGCNSICGEFQARKGDSDAVVGKKSARSQAPCPVPGCCHHLEVLCGDSLHLLPSTAQRCPGPHVSANAETYRPSLSLTRDVDRLAAVGLEPSVELGQAMGGLNHMAEASFSLL